MILEDGTGTGSRLKIDSENRMWARVITESEAQHASEEGDAYNINTGIMLVTGSTTIAGLYIKNTETRNLIIEAVAVGIGTGSALNPAVVRIVRAPTLGTIISDANVVDMNANRNFNSSKTLSSLAYKGSLGSTFTDGAPVAQFFQTHNGRLFATINFILPQGTAMGVSINPNLTAGTSSVYIAAIVNLAPIVGS